MMVARPHIDPASLVARIVAELQASPGARELLLRELLTDEFLKMPARMERVEADIAELKTDVSQLKTDVSQLKTDVSQLKTDVSQLKTDVSQLKTDVSQLKTDVSQLKGYGLEAKIGRRMRSLVSQRFGLRRTRIVLGELLLEPLPGFIEAVESAADAGRIDDGQESRLDVTDYIVSARRKTDGEQVWVAVEVSGVIGQRDIERVRASADALGIVFGDDTLAVAVGYGIKEPDQRRAEAADVHIVIVDEGD